MSGSPKVVTAETFAQTLHEAGLIEDPASIRRVIIDAQAGHVLMIYIEKYADERLLDAAMTLRGVEVRSALVCPDCWTPALNRIDNGRGKIMYVHPDGSICHVAST